MSDAKETTPVDVPAEEQTIIEVPEVDAVPTEQPDANALAVLANQESMALLASRGLLTDSHATNLSLRSN